VCTHYACTHARTLLTRAGLGLRCTHMQHNSANTQTTQGKGKLVDILAQQYDIVARAQVRFPL